MSIEEAKAHIDQLTADIALTGPDLGVPEANAYEFQFGVVVALLERLRLKFQDQRLGLENEEHLSLAATTASTDPCVRVKK